MSIYKIEQGTDEWRELRRGIPTASRFDQIITPKTLKPSSSQTKLLAELVFERITGAPFATFGGNAWTERGTELEAEARRWYEFEAGVEVETIGFVTGLDDRVGGSPDGLVGCCSDGGVVEIKCRNGRDHILALLGEAEAASPTQTQGYLWLTGRAWVDTVSYCPGLPGAIVRTSRDDAFIDALSREVADFVRRVDEAEARVRALLG